MQSRSSNCSRNNVRGHAAALPACMCPPARLCNWSPVAYLPCCIMGCRHLRPPPATLTRWQACTALPSSASLLNSRPADGPPSSMQASCGSKSLSTRPTASHHTCLLRVWARAASVRVLLCQHGPNRCPAMTGKSLEGCMASLARHAQTVWGETHDCRLRIHLSGTGLNAVDAACPLRG